VSTTSRTSGESRAAAAAAPAAPAPAPAVAREIPIVTQRSARFYALGGHADDRPPAELWLVLHGYGQLAARFIRHFRGIAGPDRLVVAPEALNRFYVPGSGGVRDHGIARVGATWMTREDREREIVDQRAYLDAVLAAVRAPWRGGPAPRLVVLGFSQGAAAAVRWVLSSGIACERVVAWGGALPTELDAAGAQALAGRVSFVAGRTDELIPLANVEKELARLKALGLEPPVVWHEGGHVMDAPTLLALANGPEGLSGP
jgi:predicted esterase